MTLTFAYHHGHAGNRAGRRPAIAADAAARLAYLRALKPPLGDGYACLVGSAVLRLSNWLTAAQVQAYRAVFTAAAAR